MKPRLPALIQNIRPDPIASPLASLTSLLIYNSHKLRCSDMPLTAGEQLGPYGILSLVGAGGMGEVYRARDTRLGRTVAIKVSREKFSARLSRKQGPSPR
jgi:serine/threonine protein kinase